MKKLTVLLTPTLLVLFALLGATQLASAANDTWLGNTDANWNSNFNWDTANPPNANDSLIFATSGVGGYTLNNNLSGLTAFNGLTFNGAAFTLNGPTGVLLSGQVLGNTVGIANSSGTAQTIGTMPLKLDWGYYTFSSSSPGTVALNGGLTLNTGGVALFDASVTSSAPSPLVNDPSGLISGLGGAGLTYSGSGSAFAGLATMSGTAIVAYSGWPSVVASAGSIGATTPGAAVNIELTATAAGNYPFANNPNITYANTIFLSAASGATLVLGNTAGAQTLDLGAVSGIGGIYVPAGVTAQAVTIGSGASTILTAGPETGGATPGTIVFAINGTSSANQALNNSTIKDNLSGGAVTVVKTGTGSMYSGATLANTYSGGTYVNQGQFQANSVSSFGTGPVYVAANASIYLNGGAVNYANELYLSPGVGAGSVANYASGGALIWGSSGNQDMNLSGTIHLLGAPGTTAPGNRISTQATSKTLALSGQITGTGTLELYQGGHSGNTILSNVTANANNWQGGILIAPRSTLSVYLKLGRNNQIPNGPGTGDITFLSGGGDTRFDLNGFSTTVNALNAPNDANIAKHELGNYSSPTVNSTLTMGASGANGTFNGITSDGAGKTLTLIKTGIGTQTFNGNAAFGYLGNTTVSQGTFALAGAGQIPNSPVITVAAGATLDVSALNAGSLAIGAAQTLNCVGTVFGNTIINGTVKALDAIGTLTETGNMTFNGGGTNVWYVNDATGTKGGDAGWSWLNISGTLDLTSLTSGSQFTINVNSLTTAIGDPPGSALHFNSAVSQSWIIATAGSINGYTDPTQFHVVHSAFSNYSGGSWDVTVSGGNLMLNYNPFNPIVSLLPATLTVNQGQNAVFTATANSLGTGTTFTWTQGATTLSPAGGTSAGGGTYSIVTSGGGLISTLTITGVDGAAPWPTTTDTSTIGATVNDTYSASPQVGTLSAALTVIDNPYNPIVTPSFGTPPVNAGAADIMCASASGTSPFTYQWYLNGNLISGATAACYQVNVSPATAGSYTVVISNPAGNVTSSPTVITSPVTEVPNQIVYEPFNYTTQPTTQLSSNPWTAFGVTNIYNQATGVGLMWVNSGALGQEWTLAQDMRIEPGYDNATLTPNGDSYPWPGWPGLIPRKWPVTALIRASVCPGNCHACRLGNLSGYCIGALDCLATACLFGRSAACAGKGCLSMGQVLGRAHFIVANAPISDVGRRSP